MLAEIGYLIRQARITPFLQYAKRNLLDAPVGGEQRTSFGLTFWWAAHKANVRGGYTRIDPNGLAKQNELTVQFQLFAF